MMLPEDSLESVKQWWNESMKYSKQSDDPLLSLITKSFETINVVLSQDSDRNCSMESIASLDNERKLALQLENEDFNVLRHLVFGLIESFPIVLLQLRGTKNGELPTLDFGGDDMDFQGGEDMNFELDNVEPIVEESFSELSNREVSAVRDLNVMEDNSVNDFAMDVDDVDGVALSELNGEDCQDFSADDLNGEEKEKEKTIVNTRKESSEIVDDKKWRRSSINIIKPSKYNESRDDSDEFGAPSKKARKRSAQRADCHSDSAKQTTKNNDTELECPECEYRTITAPSWTAHLRLKHNTNPYLAGLALLCVCGDESFTEGHSRKCDISKITVIRKRDGPIRRLDDKKTTPQCIFCEKYPKTMYGYYKHLNTHHKSTLIANEIFLTCGCGYVARSRITCLDHSKNCDAREFSLHKVDEK